MLLANRRVRVSYGRTIQPAPYESIRLDVAIEKDIPAEADMKEEVDRSVESLVSYVKAKIGHVLTHE